MSVKHTEPERLPYPDYHGKDNALFQQHLAVIKTQGWKTEAGDHLAAWMFEMSRKHLILSKSLQSRRNDLAQEVVMSVIKDFSKLEFESPDKLESLIRVRSKFIIGGEHRRERVRRRDLVQRAAETSDSAMQDANEGMDRLFDEDERRVIQECLSNQKDKPAQAMAYVLFENPCITTRELQEKFGFETERSVTTCLLRCKNNLLESLKSSPELREAVADIWSRRNAYLHADRQTRR